jgi:exodeoxyribonuclease VII large subunit
MTSDLPDSLIAETALSVAGLTDYIRFLLEQDEELQRVWVTGEVSSKSHHRSGLFFTLQDPNGGAAIKCVAWNSQLAKLAQIPVPGEQLIILGSIRLYPQRGEYQLSVWQALPAGVGLQALRYSNCENGWRRKGFLSRKESDRFLVIPRRSPLSLHPRLRLGVIFKKHLSKGIQVYTLSSRLLQYRVSKRQSR